jgi:hypothetical protein
MDNPVKTSLKASLREQAAEATRLARTAQRAVLQARQAATAGTGAGPSAAALEAERMRGALEQLAWQRYFSHVCRSAQQERIKAA